jgi:hypothetical protein
VWIGGRGELRSKARVFHSEGTLPSSLKFDGPADLPVWNYVSVQSPHNPTWPARGKYGAPWQALARHDKHWLALASITSSSEWPATLTSLHACSAQPLCGEHTTQSQTCHVPFPPHRVAVASWPLGPTT